MFARAPRKDGGAILATGTAELKRLEEGDVPVLHVPGGTGEEGDRLRFDREEERESIGWKDCDESAQNAVTSGVNARTSGVKVCDSGVKVCASGLNERFAA